MLRVVMGVCVVLTAVVARATEPVATDQLPAGLEAIGVAATNVLSQAEAQDVRGQGGVKKEPILRLWQEKTFSVTGATLLAGSSVDLMEGLLGQISIKSLSNQGMVETETTLLFGGVTGRLSVKDNGLTTNWQMTGKALQETLLLQGGVFNQNFNQWYRVFR